MLSQKHLKHAVRWDQFKRYADSKKIGSNFAQGLWQPVFKRGNLKYDDLAGRELVNQIVVGHKMKGKKKEKEIPSSIGLTRHKKKRKDCFSGKGFFLFQALILKNRLKFKFIKKDI